VRFAALCCCKISERRRKAASVNCKKYRRGERGVGAPWDCVPRVCGGGGGCAGGGVPLGAVPALSWCGEVSLGGIHIIIN